MTTIGNVVDQVLNEWLEGTFRAQYNTLQNDIDAVQESLVLHFPLIEVAKGSFVSVDDELMYVVDRDANASSITMIRAMRGTTAATHTAGTSVEVNPRFPRWLIRKALFQEIVGWPDALYQVLSFDTTLAAGSSVINDLAAFKAFSPALVYKGVLAVNRNSLDATDDRTRPVDGWRFDRPSSTLTLNRPVGVDSTLHVVAAVSFNVDDYADFHDATALSDLGVGPELEEILEMGAAGRLLTGRQVVRLQPEAQGQSREASEVSEVGMARLGGAYLKSRDELVSREVERLYRRWGFTGQGTAA